MGSARGRLKVGGWGILFDEFQTQGPTRDVAAAFSEQKATKPGFKGYILHRYIHT